MQLDLKVTIGTLFVLYGVLLSIYGVLGDQTQYTRSLGLNVNFGWGLVLLGFGLCLLLMRKHS